MNFSVTSYNIISVREMMNNKLFRSENLYSSRFTRTGSCILFSLILMPQGSQAEPSLQEIWVVTPDGRNRDKFSPKKMRISQRKPPMGRVRHVSLKSEIILIWPALCHQAQYLMSSPIGVVSEHLKSVDGHSLVKVNGFL